MKLKSESEVTQSCPTLSDPMDCSLPGSSIHGILQERVLEQVAIAFSDSKCKSRHLLAYPTSHNCDHICKSKGYPDSSVKNPPAMQETPVQFLGQEDLQEKG